jgi:thioredoxin:protein disulfide reductase
MTIWHRICTRRWVGMALLAAVLGWSTVAAAEEFLPPEQAFAFSVRPVDSRTVRLHWDIAPGYHLYRDRITVQSDVEGVKWVPLQMPAAEEQFDPNFNKMMAIYNHALDVDLQLTQGKAGQALSIGWQGCAEAGLCYPPASAPLQMNAAFQANGPGNTATASAAPVSSPQPLDGIAATLASGSLLKTLGAFLLAGLLLSFTPCVLPMVPILSSLIAGQSGPVSRSKGFALSLAYAIGMALVYASFGVAAGLAGEGLAAALQNPWVLGAFALLLSTLALSMFGIYELQMPSFIQSRATEWSNRFQGGSYIGVFLMGGVSALVCGPCVAAPLAGALVYISQTRDVVLGGSALFAMAMGMSVPLLLVGLSAGSLLPKAGMWMENVKKVFGMMLLGVAIWMVSPVLPAPVHMLLWSAWLLTAAALLGIFSGSRPTPTAARTSGAGLAAVSLVLLVGAASGGESVLQPLAHFKGSLPAQNGERSEPASLPFQRVNSVEQLNAALDQAKLKGEAVMLDFYADWCVACKELETFTFSKPQVRQRLASVRLLQADVTGNTGDDKALMKQFGLFGPPGMVFFDAKATKPRVTHKVIGYQDAETFMASLDRALPR